MGCVANTPNRFMMQTTPAAIPPLQNCVSSPSSVPKAYQQNYALAPSIVPAYSKQPALPKYQVPYNRYSQTNRYPIQSAPYRGVLVPQGQIVGGTYPVNEDYVDENTVYDNMRGSNLCSIKLLESESSRDILRPRNFRRT